MTYVANQVRHPGKTTKDRESGAQQRNHDNKRARAAYQNDTSRDALFPKTTCNGKKNRHRYMAKGGEYQIHA